MSYISSHESYIARAKKIHAQILQTYQDTVETIDKLNTEDSANLLYLLNEANAYADDLNKVVFSLSQVIFKIDRARQAHHSLQHIINIVCDLVGATHRSFHYDHKKVKTELKSNIKSATHVAEKLLAVISLDDIPELKQELLDNQADVLYAVDRVRLTNQVKLLNPQQLQTVIQDIMDGIKNALLKFNSKEPNVEQKLIQCVKHGLQKSRNCTDHLSKAVTSGLFDDEMKNLFLELINSINKYVENVHKIVLKNSPFDQLVEDIHKCVVDGVGAISKLIPLLVVQENAQVSGRGMDLIVYAFGCGAAAELQVQRSLEYASTDD